MNKQPDNSADDPHLQRIRRKLVRLMLGSILITFVLVGLVLAAVIYKIMTPTEQVANMATTLEQQIDLDAGGHIVSYSLSGDILTLQSRTAEGKDEFILYNHRLRQIISRLKITSPNI